MKKGISLIALVITMIVMVMLITSVTITAKNTIENSEKLEFASELSYVQEMINNYKLKNNNTYPSFEEYVFNTSTLNALEIKQFEGETVVSNSIVLYKIKGDILGLSDLKHGNEIDSTDVFLVSKNTGKVYYASAVHIQNVNYYTLTDELKKSINYTINETLSIDDDILFNQSQIDWTNIPVKTEIKVPKEYVDVTVNLKQAGKSDILVDVSSIDEIYNTYIVENLQNNYIIYVKYKKNTTDTIYKTKTCSINNFDNILPNIVLDPIKSIVDNTNQTTYRYINILSNSDNLSGIKNIKYENSKIEVSNIKTYFTTKGIKVENSIPVKDGVSYITVFIEDNAGNYSYIQLSI